MNDLLPRKRQCTTGGRIAAAVTENDFLSRMCNSSAHLCLECVLPYFGVRVPAHRAAVLHLPVFNEFGPGP